MREEEVTLGMRRVMDALCYLLLFFLVLMLAWLVLPNPNKDMEADYLNALIGAVFGASFALAGFYWGRREREIEARTKLAERIEFNCKRMEEIRSRFDGGDMPSFTLDTIGMVIWLHSASGVMQKELIDDIDGYRYQLDHIAEKLALVQSAFCVDMATNPEKIDEGLKRVRLRYEPSLGVVRHIDNEVIRGRELVKRIQGI